MDLVGICAQGEAAWQRAAHESLGGRWTGGAGVAWAPEGAGHRFLLGAVTLDPRPALPGGWSGTLCDSFAALDAQDLPPGHEPTVADPWMLRPPAAPPPVDNVPGLRISKVESDSEATTFEHTAFVAAGGHPPRRPGELHPPGSQHVPGLHLLIAWLGDVPSGTALAVEHDHGVVVSAVAVLPHVRGRGLGAALVAAALDTAPGRPATLAASSQGLSLYRRLGFREVIRPRHWKRSNLQDRIPG